MRQGMETEIEIEIEMKHETERVLYIVAIVAILLCGAYIGHENTLDALNDQPQQEQCADTER